MAKVTHHPKVTPRRLAEVRRLRAELDGGEQASIIARGKQVFARHERIRATIDQLKQARLRKRLTLEQVAERSGIGKANLSRLENDATPNPTLDTLLRVADAIGFDVLR